MKVMIVFWLAVLICLNSAAKQQSMDTILIFDYWESPTYFAKIGRGLNEDYLQIIINDTDTLEIDAGLARKKIKFTHKIYYQDRDEAPKKRRPAFIFSRVRFAGLEIVKPVGQSITLRVNTLHGRKPKLDRNYNFDTTMVIGTVAHSKTVLWNLYEFFSGRGLGPYYFYPRYTLHSHNWPTPQQWAKYRKRRKVLKQIENAIVYRYNTVTRQIVKS